MKRIACVILLIALTLTACGRESPREATLPAPTRPETVAVDREEMVDGKSLVIHAQVEMPDFDNLEAVTLVFDEETLRTMAKDLVLSQHPDAKEQRDETTGIRGWSVESEDRLSLSLDCFDQSFEAGRVMFLDVSRDRNGSGMGEDDLNAFTYGYITPHIPTGLEITGQEAGEAMGQFLRNYSCFTYQAWSLLARDDEAGGYYQAFLEPRYEGLPVKGLLVSACFSEKGMFTFQGVMTLKEQSRKGVEAAVTLEAAVEAFREELPWLRGTAVEVVDIRPGYTACSGYGGEWTLRPAWIFDYAQTTGQDRPQYGSLTIRMEDGEIRNIR